MNSYPRMRPHTTQNRRLFPTNANHPGRHGFQRQLRRSQGFDGAIYGGGAIFRPFEESPQTIKVIQAREIEDRCEIAPN